MAALLTEFNEGRIRFAEMEVEFGRTVDIGGSLGYVQSDHKSLWPESEHLCADIDVARIVLRDGAMRPSKARARGQRSPDPQPRTTSYVHSPFPVWTSGNADVLVSAEPRRDIAGSAATIPTRLRTYAD
jgi:hypothetical protein